MKLFEITKQKRKSDMTEYDELFGKGTWKRVTFKQEGGDDGYHYVVRVDGRVIEDGLTKREADWRKKVEVNILAKKEKLGQYAEE